MIVRKLILFFLSSLLIETDNGQDEFELKKLEPSIKQSTKK